MHLKMAFSVITVEDKVKWNASCLHKYILFAENKNSLTNIFVLNPTLNTLSSISFILSPNAAQFPFCIKVNIYVSLHEEFTFL